MKTTTFFSTVAAACLALPLFAHASSSDIHQQQRIESGLQSGQLTTREAARLERQEAKIDHAQARALRDGTLTDAEKSRIQTMQHRASQDIHAEKHDVQVGKPDSGSSKRMQDDVQHNIHQEQRIRAGLASGSLTNREAARLENGKARVERTQYRAGRDNHVGAAEQIRVRRAAQHESRRIFRQKHDRQH